MLIVEMVRGEPARVSGFTVKLSKGGKVITTRGGHLPNCKIMENSLSWRASKVMKEQWIDSNQ